MAHLLNVVGKDGQELYETFTLLENKNIIQVLKAFETIARCVPTANMIYKCYILIKCTQEVEVNVNHFITNVLKLVPANTETLKMILSGTSW